MGREVEKFGSYHVAVLEDRRPDDRDTEHDLGFV